MSKYIVLDDHGNGTFKTRADNVEARTADEAIGKAFAGITEQPDKEVVAVPKRHFDPKPVTIDIPPPKVSVGGAKKRSKKK